MEANTCFFIGHRDTPEQIMPRLTESVKRHIEKYGVTEFFVGQYGAFDRMAAHAVAIAKQQYPQVRLIAVLPYFPRERADGLPELYDGNYYPPGMEAVPKPFAIVRANEHMIRSCGYLICYNMGYVGKTRDFFNMALRREKRGLLHVDNLAPEE
ncbi:MAG: hypothetical protein IJT78_04145 [Oscillospiraceae bacterium]|nr:hypothetical protein [Oscillospiraceae bacterium]